MATRNTCYPAPHLTAAGGNAAPIGTVPAIPGHGNNGSDDRVVRHGREDVGRTAPTSARLAWSLRNGPARLIAAVCLSPYLLAGCGTAPGKEGGSAGGVGTGSAGSTSDAGGTHAGGAPSVGIYRSATFEDGVAVDPNSGLDSATNATADAQSALTGSFGLGLSQDALGLIAVPNPSSNVLYLALQMRIDTLPDDDAQLVLVESALNFLRLTLQPDGALRASNECCDIGTSAPLKVGQAYRVGVRVEPDLGQAYVANFEAPFESPFAACTKGGSCPTLFTADQIRLGAGSATKLRSSFDQIQLASWGLPGP